MSASATQSCVLCEVILVEFKYSMQFRNPFSMNFTYMFWTTRFPVKQINNQAVHSIKLANAQEVRTDCNGEDIHLDIAKIATLNLTP